MFLQGLVEEASDAIFTITDANDNAGFGSDGIIVVTSAAFGKLGDFNGRFAVGEEIFVDRFLLVFFLFGFLGVVSLLAIFYGLVGIFLAQVDSGVDVAVVIISVG